MKLEASRVFLNGCDMTDFVQSENNVAECFLNFLKLVTLSLLTPCSRELQFSNRLLPIVFVTRAAALTVRNLQVCSKSLR